MVFCNTKTIEILETKTLGHNPYFNRWFSAIFINVDNEKILECVTILILIDGFLQYEMLEFARAGEECHNPYFNRWFSAMKWNMYF